MENHHISWVNPLFLWPFPIAKLEMAIEIVDLPMKNGDFP
jgi:hypothetical protein